MAVLAVVKKGAGSLIRRAADGAGNLVAKASSLSSAQLQVIEEERAKYLSEKPETDPEQIKRLLGSYAIEAYEAYLTQLQTLYRPISLGEYSDNSAVNSRIRYFEVTKWVTDPTENNLDKLTNLYRVLSEEACNIALIYDRKRSGVKVYFAVVNTAVSSFPGIANMLRDRLMAALRGNFPGVEIVSEGAGYGSGIPEPLKDTENCSMAIVSNVPTEKSEKFISQSMEKLLDGIVPTNADEEYTIVLLATPSQDALERKVQLGELYSQLSPYASWSTAYTYTETSGRGSSATTGLNLGASIGRQTGLTNTVGTNSSHTDNQNETHSRTETDTTGDSTGDVHTVSDTTTDSKGTSRSEGSQKSETTQDSQFYSYSDQTSSQSGGGLSDTEGTNITGTVNAGVNAKVNLGFAEFGGDVGGSVATGSSTSHTASSNWSQTVSKSVANSVSAAVSSMLGTSTADTETVNKAISKAVSEALSRTHSVSKSVAKGVAKSTGVADTIGKMASTASNVGHSLGANIGANFARSSTVSVTVGKNETLTQQFTNFTVQDTLEVIKKQMKRLDQSASLGMWDFSAYFLSRSQTVANNAAHMYLSLTQGEESYLSQSAVNFWEYNTKNENDIAEMMTFLRRLQHPEFVLDQMEENWLMYPPHVNATVALTGRELSYALNLPKKSVSGLPVLECVPFGREIQRFSEKKENEESVYVGKVYHMRKVEKHIPVKLDLQSLCSHTFVTGSTGTGKSNFIYNILHEIRTEYQTKFLVIEPAKGEYKNVFGGYKNVTVYGTNPLYTELLQINPFSFPPYISVLEHIDRLVEIFNACWPMYAAMPAVLKDAIEQVYREIGWSFANPGYYSDAFPTFSDLIRVLPEIMENSLYSSDTKSDYSGALITRVKSLTNGINGAIFCSDTEISEKDLFDRNVIVDISRVGSSETKSLIMGILIMKLQEYRMQPGVMNEKLKHVTVIEEAHNLLRKTSFSQSQEGSNLQGKSVEMITNAIAEMRTYGEGFIIADQAPDMLDEAVIRNTNTKIVLRLPNEADCHLVGKAIALRDEQIHELAKLPAFVAVVYQNDWVEAVLCKSDQFTEGKPYSYEPKDFNAPIRHYLTNIFKKSESTELDHEEQKAIKEWIDRLENSDYTKNLLRNALQGEHLTSQQIQVIAYNLFNGQKLAMLLRDAQDTAQGICAVEKEICRSYQFRDQTIIDAIRQQVCAALMTIDSCDDITRRYQYFGMKGGLM